MPTRDPATVIADFIDRINSGDVPMIVGAMTSDHEFIDSVGSRLRGRKAMLEAWQAYFRLFPDYRIHVERLIARSDGVVVLGRSSGTLSAEGAAELAGPDGVIPGDDELQGPAIWFCRVRDGLVASWQVFDDTPEVRESLGVPETDAIFRGVNVVSIAVPDLQEAKAFYKDILGLGEPVYDLPDAGWIEFSVGTSGCNLSITTEGYEAVGAQRTTIVLDTDDCRAAHKKLTALGVRCEAPVEFTGYVVYCTFYDPFGNRLQMSSPA